MIITVVSLAVFLMNTPAFSMSESALIDQLDGLNAHQALALANQWHWEKQPVRTHITSKEVVFQFESGKVKKIPLPTDEMMVAVAPFINRTHKWGVHFMSSCQGELTQTKLNVKAVDQSGTVIMDKPVSTLRNGFMELWLPRNRTINLTISGLNRSATDVITTSDGSATCITTMQLQ
jgi:hypothetical protein